MFCKWSSRGRSRAERREAPRRALKAGPWAQHPLPLSPRGTKSGYFTLHPCGTHPHGNRLLPQDPGPRRPAFHLPATHREVRHRVVVGLQDPGVFEDVVPKRVEPIQGDEELGAGDPLLGGGEQRGGQGMPSAGSWAFAPTARRPEAHLAALGVSWDTGTGQAQINSKNTEEIRSLCFGVTPTWVPGSSLAAHLWGSCSMP